jgi:hypothetical protein
MDANQQKATVTEVIVDSISLVGKKTKRTELEEQVISMNAN